VHERPLPEWLVPVIAPARRDHGALLVVCLVSGCWMEVPGDEPAPLDELEVQMDNGIFLENGLYLGRGSDVGNGIKLTNGLNLANGIDLPNGIKLTNGVRLIAPPAGSDLEKWIDADPTMRLRIIRYQVGCALSADTAIDVVYRGTRFTFPGEVGLGKSWLAGLMTGTDQQRVSACLLARVNARGDHLRILLVGPYPGLDSLTDEERALYPTREATFMGNLFGYPPLVYIANIQPCGSRACHLDPDTGACDCGALDAVTSCYSNGADYDTSCRFTLWQKWSNPITVYVAQKRAGGTCASNTDCIYYNCQSGVCGSSGAECVSAEMCASGTCTAGRTCAP
jgi:hypothetical protein